jgi:hypothetical protein
MIKFRVKDEPQTIDDSYLISRVKSHEHLFDTKHPDYRNLPQRAIVWASIAKELGIADREFKNKFFHFICLQRFFSLF